MTVRPATLDDRFAILRLGRAFVDTIGLLPFDAPYAERTVKDYVQSPDKICLVLDDGGIYGFFMGSVGSHPFWPVRVASELAWWVDPSHRGRGALKLLAAYEAWAGEQGCDLVGMAHLGDDRLSRLYERHDYQRTETHFLKRL